MEYLKYFITEEIYILPPKEDNKPENPSPGLNKDAAPQPPEVESDTRKYPATIISPELNEDEKKLLIAILGAVKLDPNDVQHINNCNVNSADRVLVFGNFPEKQHLPKYQILMEDGKKLLIADELKIIKRDISKKQMLWTALQQMFSI